MIIDIPKDSDFTIHNLPFGIFSTINTPKRVGVAIGEQVLDLVALAELGVFDFDKKVLTRDFLNDFIALGKPITNKVRTDIQEWLQDKNSPLTQKKELFISQSNVQMHLPVRIGDYTDFYSSLEHATNVGKMFRNPENALLPNWRHLPVAYHGRASSIVISGKTIKRPKGQILPNDSDIPVFQASTKLDFELEVAFIIGKESELGTSISTEKAEEYIFGLVLLNDWSARDIQKWEYVPLGPFLGKNFASSISPWIVTLEALAPFKVAGPTQIPEVSPYLQYSGKQNYDLQLEVSLRPQNGVEQTVCQSNFKYMYWNMKQQLAHHTVGGCNVKIGDMMASGTISGKDEKSYGSMLELSQSGKKTLLMKDGSTRTFLEDGDCVKMRAHAEKNNIRLGFGELINTVTS